MQYCYPRPPPPQKIRISTPVKFEDGPGFTWALGSRVPVLNVAA